MKGRKSEQEGDGQFCFWLLKVRGLADLSEGTASGGGLETEGLPKRDTVIWMIE